MSSEVRVRVSVWTQGEDEPRRLPIKRLSPTDEPLIFADYENDPPRQFVISNIGRAALVERTEIAPVDRLPESRRVIAELTRQEPQQAFSYADAMNQRCELLVRYVPPHLKT